MGAPSFDDPEMREIFEGFLIETHELLDNLSHDLMELEDNPDDLDLLNRIFRGAHTIKGTSSFMGFEDITKITHRGEEILNKLRRGELKVNLSIIDVLLEMHDWIEKLVDNIQADEPEEYDFSETIKAIDKLIVSGSSTSAKSDKTPEVQKDKKDSNDSEKGNVKGSIQKVLDNPDISAGEGDFTDNELELIQQAFQELNQEFDTEPVEKSPEKTSEKIEINVSEKKIPEKKKDKPISSKKGAKKSGKAQDIRKKAAETIRIDITRIEALMDLSGELVLARNRLSQITETVERELDNKELVRDISETTEAVDFVTSEIQTAAMKMRMVPVAKLYQKAPRIVRDLSKEFGKKMKLVVKGEETEIDRGIIEELNDPLVHMIRNSCDHGIEPAEERLASGKPEIGIITLDAEQEGNAIVLRISDDGKGMSPMKLKEIAINKELITEEQADQMSDRDALKLIFQPGFSTAKVVTAVSGRGVGMDVVRSNIQKLKGLIDIESEIGKGSTFVIKLPLTLAIIQGLLVKLSTETYAIPLSSVEEVVSINTESISTINNQEVIRIRQNVLPLIRLDKILDSPEIVEELVGRYVVVVGLGVHRVGLVVDELIGQQEIVIKSIGEYLGHVQGIAGSTILGDGKVIMIIDIAELVQAAYSDSYRE